MKIGEYIKKQRIPPLNLFYIIFTAAMSILTIALYLYAETGRIEAKETSELTADRISIMQEISLNIELAMNTYSMHYTDPELNAALRGLDSYNDPEYAGNSQYILKMISYIVGGNHMISDICFAGNRGGFLSKTSLSDVDRKMIQEEIERYPEGAPYQISEVYDNQSILEQRQRVLLTRQIFSMNTMEKVGYMVYLLDFSELVNVMERTRFSAEDELGMFVFSESQMIYQQPEGDIPDKIRQKAFEHIGELVKGEATELTVEVDGKPYVVTMEQDSVSKWFFVTYYRESMFWRECIVGNVWVIIFITALCIFMIFIQIRSFQFLNETVYHLKKAMETMEGGNFVELDQRFENHSDLRDVVAGFNKMSHSLKQVIQENYVQELKRKEAELKMLQFQINPHFLYNTLNLISSLAVLDGEERIVSITDNMAEMFRYNMQGNYSVTVEDELNLIKRYLVIQELRFPKKFVVEYELDQDLLQCKIEKFTLQPLVENVFAHNRAKGKLRIKIALKKKNEELYALSIWDNGFGIEPQKLKELNAKLEEPNSEDAKTIGIFNVNNRLKRRTGDIYGLKLYSEYKEWTEVVIILPISELDVDYEIFNY